ncbi:hypothetical protein Baya_4837 [Bagarius yarrelli]|uniref:Uncharacterized protein n=1 Tax=Bagarius yarrelli TaxID=175774 RepID=A0A556TRP4_BAGYA|nr:hypothetical protein Baya_4837 [Bagarius yarrelli]
MTEMAGGEDDEDFKPGPTAVGSIKRVFCIQSKSRGKNTPFKLIGISELAFSVVPYGEIRSPHMAGFNESPGEGIGGYGGVMGQFGFGGHQLLAHEPRRAAGYTTCYRSVKWILIYELAASPDFLWC